MVTMKVLLKVKVTLIVVKGVEGKGGELKVYA